MDETIKKISLEKFGYKPDYAEQILDKGKVNKVFKVSINNENYIFRFNKLDYFNSYQKEFYCIKKAEEIGIPVSKVYFIGKEDEYSFMILNYIDGINGVDLPKEKYADIYKTLGQYAKKFNSIEVGGFGRDVKNEQEGFFKDWRTFYVDKIQSIFEDGIFVEKEVIKPEQLVFIKNRIFEMKDWSFKPKLCHGNLHITNTIVSSEGTVYLIDWGNGIGHLSPHVDLADLIAWRDRQYLDDFLDGYEMSIKEFSDIEHDVNTLLIVQLLNVINYALKNGKEFTDKDFIENSIDRIMSIK